MRLSTLVAALLLLASTAGLMFFPDGLPGDRNPALSHGLLLVIFFVCLALVAHRMGRAFALRGRGSAAAVPPPEPPPEA